jgi:RNA polymerase sigma factor (sigma-70 family)
MGEQSVEELLASFEGMIIKLARKWTKEPRVPFEDLYSIGQMTVINAERTFDADRGVKLSTYVYNALQNAMLDFFKRNRFGLHCSVYFQEKDLDSIKEQEARSFSLDKNWQTAADWSLKDLIQGSGMDPAAFAEAKEEWELLQHEINNGLTDREAYIVNHSKRWWGHKTFEEIGDDLNITKQRVSQIQKDIFDKLYEKFATKE